MQPKLKAQKKRKNIINSVLMLTIYMGSFYYFKTLKFTSMETRNLNQA